MRRRHSRFGYWLEMLFIRLRDVLRSPAAVLRECGVRSGMSVLDFGCGPGGFSIAAAILVGSSGTVYAVDIEPAALRIVRRAAARRALGNLQVLARDEIEQLTPEGVDMVLLYDVLHINPNRAEVTDTLRAIHRVLKPAGVLSVRDHHIDDARLTETIIDGGLFRFLESACLPLQFEKVDTPGGNA